ncbi:MAG: Holliday junction branch migration protein RuvA [Lachnospiraceae bacterium]|jgi:Holliday junction DNA helicase RuvA
MIGYIIGTVTAVSEGLIVLENNGVGYNIIMPGSSLYKLGVNDTDVRVYTYMSVREDDVSLFGFLSRNELNMFKMLITVSGVGPKGAIGILSSIGVDELKMAIAAEDAKLISVAKGVGSKTAQKIIVELKSKIDKDLLLRGESIPSDAGSAAGSSSSITSEAIEALEVLGFGRTASVKAINRIEITEGMTSSELVSLALGVIE